MKTTRRGRPLVIATVASAAVAGLGGGVALGAGIVLDAPAGLSATPGVETVPMPEPRYDVNANGLTVGSLTEAIDPASEPDLIEAMATNGKAGYLLKVELDEANGATAALSFTSPEEALAWQESEGLEDRTVPIYAIDGKTQIGEFVIAGYRTQFESIDGRDTP